MRRPQENDSHTLLVHVLGPKSDYACAARDQSRVRGDIDGRIRKDFGDGGAAMPGGWVDSLSEARLCVLQALAA